MPRPNLRGATAGDTGLDELVGPGIVLVGAGSDPRDVARRRRAGAVANAGREVRCGLPLRRTAQRRCRTSRAAGTDRGGRPGRHVPVGGAAVARRAARSPSCGGPLRLRAGAGQRTVGGHARVRRRCTATAPSPKPSRRKPRRRSPPLGEAATYTETLQAGRHGLAHARAERRRSRAPPASAWRASTPPTRWPRRSTRRPPSPRPARARPEDRA